MAATVLVLLIVLWFFGYITVPGIAIPRHPLFFLNKQPITLWTILLLVLMLWAIEVLPSPIRELCAILFILWLLSVLGIITIAGLPNLLTILIIIGIIIALFNHRSS